MTAVEGAIGFRQQALVRNHLFEPVGDELALDRGDKIVARHCVQLDPLVKQDVDLGPAGEAVIRRAGFAQDMLGGLVRRRGRLALETANVFEPGTRGR